MKYPYSKKKWMSLMLTAAVMLSFQPAGTQASSDTNTTTSQEQPAGEAIHITVNGKEIQLPGAEVYIEAGSQRTMVPVRFVSESLAASVDWAAEKNQVTITQAGKTIVITIGEAKAKVGEQELTLDAPASLRNGRTYVPLRFISEALGATVDWKQDERLISIQTASAATTPDTTKAETAPSTVKPADVLVSPDVANPPNQTEVFEPTGSTLAMADAVKLAMQSNADLNTLRLDAKNADINARLVSSSVRDIPSEMIDSLQMAQQKYVNNAKAAMAKKVNEQFLKATESKIKLAVEKAYYDLLNAKDDLALKQQALKRAEAQLKIAKVSYEVGTRAKTDVLQAEAGVSAAKAALAVSESNVSIANMKLNDVMGTSLTKTWEVVPEALSAESRSMSVDSAIALAVKQRPEVMQKQEELKVAEINVELIAKYSALSTYPGKISRNDVEKAKLAIGEAERAVSVEAAQAYYNMEAARKALESYEKAKAAAEENYRLSMLRYENGMATTLEVLQADEELSNRANQHRSAVYQYNLAIISFDNAIGK
ncbi:stalk domain-containing protein [Brevibacillus migulae]|uniref:stalk domain-containing protein n=1 Tax=Brevibacillus migulae TaxID=1644114 RepID=UPI00142FED7C|nr:stalk domain-containing protein [Brevibacillus migulae]